MLRMCLRLFEGTVGAVLASEEFKSWLIAVDGPGAVAALERIRAHAADECGRKGW
jgi:hypothetical protein